MAAVTCYLSTICAVCCTQSCCSLLHSKLLHNIKHNRAGKLAVQQHHQQASTLLLILVVHALAPQPCWVSLVDINCMLAHHTSQLLLKTHIDPAGTATKAGHRVAPGSLSGVQRHVYTATAAWAH